MSVWEFAFGFISSPLLNTMACGILRRPSISPSPDTQEEISALGAHNIRVLPLSSTLSGKDPEGQGLMHLDQVVIAVIVLRSRILRCQTSDSPGDFIHSQRESW